MLKRKAYEKLLEWKQQQAGKTAVLIEGARRVGKSTLAKEFGLNEYKSCLVIDFFQAPDEVKQYFRDYSNDFDALFLYLSAYYSVELFDRESLVVFDEVQMFPFARGLVKYLVADGRYDYVETGSLLSIKQNIQDIVVPSEEQTLVLAPFDFEEFLWAMGEKPLAQLIGSSFDSLSPFPTTCIARRRPCSANTCWWEACPSLMRIYTEQRKFQQSSRAKRRSSSCIATTWRASPAVTNSRSFRFWTVYPGSYPSMKRSSRSAPSAKMLACARTKRRFSGFPMRA